MNPTNEATAEESSVTAPAVVVADPIRVALERLVMLSNALGIAHEWEPWTNALAAARAALAAAPPAAHQPAPVSMVLTSSPEVLDALEALPPGRIEPLPPSYIDPEHQGEDLELLQTFYAACRAEGGTADEIHLRGLRAVLAARPAPPAEGEVAQLLTALRGIEDCFDIASGMEGFGPVLSRALDLLEQRHAAPVPVSERLPGPEDCDAEGRCWWGAPALSGTVTGSVPHSWRLCRPYDRFGSELVWLPATDLPLPAAEAQP